MTWGGSLAVVGRALLGATPRTTSTEERVDAGLTVLSRVGWRCVGPLVGPLIPAWFRRLTTLCVPFLVEWLREGRCLSPARFSVPARWDLLPWSLP